MHVCTNCRRDIEHSVPVRIAEGTYCSWACRNIDREKHEEPTYGRFSKKSREAHD